MANATQLYADCVEQNVGSVEGLLTCLTAQLLEQDALGQAKIQRTTQTVNNVMILFSASLAFFMQAGFAMICAGAVRKKNLQNTMLKNLLDACGAALAFYAVGYAFAFGDGSNPNGFIGTTHFFLQNVDDIGFWLFQFAFTATSTTIVAGTLAERCQMAAYFYYSVLLSGFVYPVVVHVIWSKHGFLSAHNANPLLGVGVVDIAGSGVVHLTGGITSLVATYILGPRRGRFHNEQTGEPLDKPKAIQGHSIGLQLLGCLVLWFGWYGFNAGSAFLTGGDEHGDILANLAAANSTLAAGAGGCAALFLNYYVMLRSTGEGTYDLVHCMNGVLAGLVSITAGCAVIEPWAAVIIGGLGGIFYLCGSWSLVQLRLDDAVDAIPVHMLNGIWGLLAVGLFATPDGMEQAYRNRAHPGLFYAGENGRPNAALLGSQVIGVLYIMVWAVGTMFPFFLYLEFRGSFRVGAREEVTGLDRSYHGGLQVGADDDVDQDQITKLTKQVEEQLRQRRRQNSEERGSERSIPRSVNESPV